MKFVNVSIIISNLVFMATIASCFKIELEEAERRMKVFNELLKIEWLSISEIIKAEELLMADTRKCDYF